MPDLSVEIADVRLKNPVLPASGTYEPKIVPGGVFSPRALGAVINKTVTLAPQPGNPPPRIWETPCGMLNSIGIPSPGLEHFITNDLPLLRKLNTRLIVSIAGFSVKEFSELAERISEQDGVDLIELNLSCPNLRKHTAWSQDIVLLKTVISAVRKAVKLPLIAKLSPNVTDITETALTAQDAGADALSLVNTFRGLAIDIRARIPALGNISGGLSGPAIRPLALYAVYAAFKKIGIPIIGMGGITCWQDAIEYFLAGATAIAVGMYNFVDPSCMGGIIQGIDEYLDTYGFSAVKDIIGLAHRD
jgi:dihydroorotate dehydrogenase (NAD+) catalytic subunit